MRERGGGGGVRERQGGRGEEDRQTESRRNRERKGLSEGERVGE